MPTLVIDTGQDIVGVYCVEDGKYVAYRGKEIRAALDRIETANEVVTYNGEHHDLAELGKFAGLPSDQQFPLNGIHTDMRVVCWSDRIWGSSLRNTYEMHFNSCQHFPDTYEGSNELDVYMTFKLWELWKQGQLRVLDGNDVPPSAP